MSERALVLIHFFFLSLYLFSQASLEHRSLNEKQKQICFFGNRDQLIFAIAQRKRSNESNTNESYLREKLNLPVGDPQVLTSELRSPESLNSTCKRIFINDSLPLFCRKFGLVCVWMGTNRWDETITKTMSHLPEINATHVRYCDRFLTFRIRIWYQRERIKFKIF